MVSTPRRTIVHQHPFRQPVALKDAFQMVFHPAGALRMAGSQAHQEARMIVQHGERMTHRTVHHLEVPLEVHLPQLVGLRHLKPLHRPVLLPLVRRQHVMATQDGRDRAGRRHRLHALLQQLPLDLAPTPRRMFRAHFEHSPLRPGATPARAVLGATTTIIQPRLSFAPETASATCSPFAA